MYNIIVHVSDYSRNLVVIFSYRHDQRIIICLGMRLIPTAILTMQQGFVIIVCICIVRVCTRGGLGGESQGALPLYETSNYLEHDFTPLM